MAKKIKKGSLLKAIFPSIIIIILILFFAGFLIFSNWRIYQRRTDLTSQIQALEKQVQEVEKRNQELKAGISQLSDKGYLEEMAREKLGLKKPGEEVVVVVPPSESQAKETPQKTFWQKVLEKIKFW